MVSYKNLNVLCGLNVEVLNVVFVITTIRLEVKYT